MVVKNIFKCEIFFHWTVIVMYYYHHNHPDTHLTKKMKTAVGFMTENTDDAAAGSV